MIGLAISTLLPINDRYDGSYHSHTSSGGAMCRCVLSRFGVLFTMCLEVLHDICDHNDDDILFE